MTGPAPDHPDWVGLSSELGVFTTLFSATIPHGSTSGVIDVSGYQSIVVSGGGVSVGNPALYVVDAGTSAILDILTGLPTGGGTTIGPVTLPLNSGQIVLQNQGGADLAVTLIATNRQALDRGRGFTSLGIDDITVASGAIGAGTTPLGQGKGQGAAFTTFTVGGTTVAGLFFVLCDGLSMIVADTSQFHTVPTGSRLFSLNWVAPVNPWQWEFFCTTPGTANLAVDTVYL